MVSRMRRPNTNVYRSRLVYGTSSSSTNQPTTSRSSGLRRTVKNGKDLSRSDIITALENFLKSPVHPFCVSSLDNGNVTFYVRKSEEGNAILSASRRATTSSGRKLVIETQSASPPCIELVDSEKEVLKQVLASLFCAETHHLNLGGFSQNTVIRNHREYMPINRNSVMLAITTLLSDQGGLIHSIDLSNNRLRLLDYLANLVSFTPNVIALDLNGNQVDSMDQLRKLSGWKLNQLNVKQNPFYKEFKSEPEYHRVMLSIFPQLTLLDGIPVVKEETLNFGLDESAVSAAQINWPPALGSFLVNDELKDLLIRFFMEYYSCFDSTETSHREKLLHAYTKTGDLIGCCMNGSLKMISPGEPDVYLLFTRSFVLRRVTAQGLCIENDMMNVRNVSEEELQSYRTTVQNALNTPPQIPAAVNQQMGQISAASTSTPVNLVSQAAQSPVAMGELLSRETNLRLEWAMKCLEDNGWQYDNAKNAFLRLLEQGNVPSQAFRN
ncbi:Nuclear RNA export factor 1 [Trichinella pseudospiralis]|uniref:Nuclear RNA export factor 1 n=1 Tax=Trichinella pseudospiralis TaxID=6337 RepID=A0A0V0XWQ8_TRIPS|nr:Nuclear RNA export factor 1 [Trichinella pseudospiralis]